MECLVLYIELFYLIIWIEHKEKLYKIHLHTFQKKIISVCKHYKLMVHKENNLPKIRA